MEENRFRSKNTPFQAIDCGKKKITVNAVAPGAIKTDMYQAVAREYIPGGENFSDEEVDKVSGSLAFICIPTLR